MDKELFDFDFLDPSPAPTATDPFSLLPVHEKLKSFKAVATEMVAEAKALTVHDEDSARVAVDLAAKAKKKSKEIEAARKEIVKPHNDFISAVNRLAKDCTAPLAQIEAILKKKISEYEARVRLALAKAQEAARQEAARLQAELNAQAEAAGVAPPKVIPPVLPDAPAPIRTETGAATQRKEWTFEIIDPQAIPREYLMIDERAIRDAIRRGIREIPGVRIFEQLKTVIRA